jgi:hypothetical protein
MVAGATTDEFSSLGQLPLLFVQKRPIVSHQAGDFGGMTYG